MQERHYTANNSQNTQGDTKKRGDDGETFETAEWSTKGKDSPILMSKRVMHGYLSPIVIQSTERLWSKEWRLPKEKTYISKPLVVNLPIQAGVLHSVEVMRALEESKKVDHLRLNTHAQS